MYFTSGGCAAETVRFADSARLALPVYDAVAATLVAANEVGTDVLLPGEWRGNSRWVTAHSLAKHVKRRDVSVM